MNKNKNMKTHANHFAIKFFVASTMIFALFSASCSTLGGFNQRTATALIEKDAKYKTPVTIPINIRRRLTNAGADTPQLSADDTAEAAAIRAKEDFAKRQPQLIVAESLGLIKLHFENPELVEPQMGQPGYRTNLKIWTFQPRAEITDKGKAIWTKLNLPVNEENLPVAVRGTPEVTALKDDNERTKSGDFTYRWDVTELGAAFNVNSEAFKKLAPEVQQSLQSAQFDLTGQGDNNLMNFDKPRRARVFFQKNNDEWKLREFYFM